MANTPYGSGGCCPQRADDVTQLKIGERGVVVGLIGLDTVFQQLHTLGRHSDEVTDEELVEMARKFNYIPRSPGVEADYAAALRQAYSLFYIRIAQAANAQDDI